MNLVGLIGLQSFGPAGFLTAASRMIGFGPAVSLPIFEGGRLRGNLAGTNADYDIAVEQYNQLLADALRDIVDQMTSLASVDAQHRNRCRRSPMPKKPMTWHCCAIARASATTCKC